MGQQPSLTSVLSHQRSIFPPNLGSLSLCVPVFRRLRSFTDVARSVGNNPTSILRLQIVYFDATAKTRA